MELKNSAVRVREIGALIATRARCHLANRGSETAEIDARTRKVTPRNKAISAPICITRLERNARKMVLSRDMV